MATHTTPCDETGNPYSATNPLPTSGAVLTGDIEIGAVEIKDGVADIRQTVLAASTAAAATDKAAVVDLSPNGVVGAAGDAASLTGSLNAKLRAIATALGITALDLGSGTGGSRTLRWFQDTAQWIGGAGAVTAAVQRTTLASDDPAVATLGATTGVKVITDANGTIQQYLRGLVSQWVAGTLTLASTGYSAAVSLTRTNDTNAYTANDVVGSATGSTAALTFAIGPSAGGEVQITSVSLEIDATAIISGETSYRLYLYNVTPPSAYGDNVAWDIASGDRASFLGYVDLGTPVDLGSTLYVKTDLVNTQIKLASGNAFGLLVTNGAYTPTASRVHVITLHSIAV